MVTFQDKQFLIDGKPTLILSGEIHYFRLKKSQWQKAIDELKGCGCNTVASYIPWLCHEYEEGQFDLTGKSREELDLKAFLELCKENDLFFIARPGPFIMAEVKNEGIPYWIYEKYPHLSPIAWNSNPATTATCDYLHPDFLACAERWYQQVMPMLAEYLPENGGNLIGVQMDNEIGMLSWVSNCPDLTDYNLGLFIEWVNKQYGDQAEQRYHQKLTPDAAAFSLLRSPNEEIALSYHKDLGYFMRERFRRYVHTLKSYAENAGIHGVPFFVNVHGSGDSIGSGYPIGLSQLMETYRGCDDILAASDFYIGDVHIGNYAGIYLANAFTDCLNSPDQPPASLEFEAGDGNYAFNFNCQYSPSAIDIKSRLFVAQGNRLLNYYLLAGGENYRLPTKVNDGNDRIAFTGQKHGFAAPLDPYLNRGTSYNMTRDVITLLGTNRDSLSTMSQETDNVVLSFIPDYYMTEYHYPDSKRETEMIAEIKKVRDSGYYTVLAKSLLLTQHNFKALDIQNHNILETLGTGKTLILASCLYLSREIQQNVCDFIRAGGNVMIYGRLPIYDMEGNSCTLLADLIGAEPLELFGDRMLDHRHYYYCSVYPCGFASEYPEVRNSTGQSVSVSDAEVFLRHYGTDAVCGFRKEVGKSRVVCLLAEYHVEIQLMEELFSYLGIQKRYAHTAPFYGMFLLPIENSRGEAFLNIINVEDFSKEFELSKDGNKLFPYSLTVGAKRCLLLPFEVKALPDVTVLSSTAEIFRKDENSITFRLTQKTDHILLRTSKSIALSHPGEKIDSESGVEIIVKKGVIDSDFLTTSFS